MTNRIKKYVYTKGYFGYRKLEIFVEPKFDNKHKLHRILVTFNLWRFMKMVKTETKVVHVRMAKRRPSLLGITKLSDIIGIRVGLTGVKEPMTIYPSNDLLKEFK